MPTPDYAAARATARPPRRGSVRWRRRLSDFPAPGPLSCRWWRCAPWFFPFGSTGFSVKKHSPQRRRVHRGFVQLAIFRRFSLRPLRLGGANSDPLSTQMPEKSPLLTEFFFEPFRDDPDDLVVGLPF